MDFRPYSWRGQIREIYKVLEYRGGAVYKTKRLGYVICKHDEPCIKPAAILASLGTKADLQLQKTGRLV